MKKQILGCLFCFMMFIIISCDKESMSRPIEIGVFGGSQSISYSVQPIKDKWADMFNARFANCGIVGAGFNSLNENNVPNQIMNNKTFDVYILWCSTNDYFLDINEDNEDDPKTQSGGLKRTIELIRSKNAKAKILLFTSVYVPHEKILKFLPQTVAKQVDFCHKHQIPYLNQFDYNVLDESDFKEDRVHLLQQGYWKLEPRQTEFLNKYL